MIPVLVTDRMVLREPRIGDFEPYAAFYASPRAIHEDGPFGRDRAWEKFATSRALWSFRGYGAFSAEDRETGDYLGEFGLFQPAHYPEPELGWMVVEGHEGRGLATEAARAVRNWARRERGLTGLVNYIGPQNIRSMRVAKRLGAVRDDAAPRPEGEDCVVYRHPSEDFL